MADGDEGAADLDLLARAGLGVAQPDALELAVVAGDELVRHERGLEADVVALGGPLEHDLRGAELVAAVDDRQLAAYLEMKIESSIAESPPPTTTTFSPLKKAPSQTPQVETPRPPSSSSPGMPRRRGSAPIARITVLARYSSSPTQTLLDAAVGELDAGGVVGDEAGAEALGLGAELLHHLRAHDPLGEARVVLDVGRVLKLPAPLEALDHERLEVGAGGVERGGVAGAGRRRR